MMKFKMMTFKEIAEVGINWRITSLLKHQIDDLLNDYLSIFGMTILAIYEYLWIILFTCLVRVVAGSIQDIIKNVESHFSTGVASGNQLTVWNETYLVTFDLVTEMNGFFGPTLVALLANNFLKSIFYVYKLVYQVVGNDRLIIVYWILKIIKNLIKIAGFVHGAEILKKKVIDIVNCIIQQSGI